MCYNKIGDNMKIEKWIYKGEEINVPIVEEDEIEKNLEELENTLDLSKELSNLGDNNE